MPTPELFGTRRGRSSRTTSAKWEVKSPDFDVLIVGGGVMGSATAYHLASDEAGASVCVIERDDTYQHASTVLSDGNVRVQFNLAENIRMSQYTLDLLPDFGETFATSHFIPDPAPRYQGNLFTVDASGRAPALEGLQLQDRLGVESEWLDPVEIAERWPILSTTGLEGATFGPHDGSVDPTAVLRGLRAKATELGAKYKPAEVTSLLGDRTGVMGVRLNDSSTITAGQVVVTAGPWSTGLLEGIGIHVPVVPYMRTVYVVNTPFPSDGLPSFFLPNGVYAISESDNVWLMGWSRDDDPIGFEFIPAGRDRFENLIWPSLVEHVPTFEQLHVERAWAGIYSVNTLDHNAILGPWPGSEGLLVAVGFSGHGFQHGPAVGRYLSELILGRDHALDLSRLSAERVLRNEPLLEHAGRLI